VGGLDNALHLKPLAGLMDTAGTRRNANASKPGRRHP